MASAKALPSAICCFLLNAFSVFLPVTVSLVVGATVLHNVSSALSSSEKKNQQSRRFRLYIRC